MSGSVRKSRVLIVGCGGIGSMVAFNLEQGGLASVTAVLRSNYDTVEKSGFRIDSQIYGQQVGWKPSHIVRNIEESVTPASDGPDQAYDFIVCTTKNIPESSPSICDLIRPAVTLGRSIVVLIQNGLNIEKSVQKEFPKNICLSGVSFMNAFEVKPGHIQQTDKDRLVISPFPSPIIDHQLEAYAALEFQTLYASAGNAQCEYEPNVHHIRWRKLLYNAVWNPVCAITDMDTTQLRVNFQENDPLNPVNTLIRPAINEIRAAAKAAAGIDFPEEIVEEIVHADPIEISCVPSMLQDRRRGKLMEYEYLVGEPLRAGESAGVSMPTVRCIFGLCKALQSQLMPA